MQAWFVRVSLFCLCVALLPVVAVHAQAADPARSASARTLFEEGIKKADAAQWSEAANLFERALALRDSPVIRFNLSSALVELNRMVEASELLRALEIDQRAAPDLRESARKNREALLPRLAKLTIVVDGLEPSMQVLLDDYKVEPAQLGVALPVDPTAHHLVLRSEERLLDDEHVTLREGESRDVKLVGAVPTPAVAAAAAPVIVGPVMRPRHVDVGEPEPAPDKRKKRIWWGVGAGAVAVTAGVVAAVLLAGRSSHSGTPQHGFTPGSVGIRVPQ